MAKTDAWMPIYIGDYLRDTEELSSSEHGAYLLLLMHYWQKKGIIGCDVDRLARVARSDSITCRFVLGYFFTLVDGNYKNKRADKEMENAEGRRRSSRENGQKGGRPPINNLEITGWFPVGIPSDNLDHNLRKSSSSSSSEEYKNNMQKTFRKPDVDEIKAYCLERHNSIDPEKFFNHYESVGWKVGSKPMKNWQAAVRTWERNSFDSGKSSQASLAVIDKPVPKRKCESCGSTDLAPSWCRVCKWDFIQEPHQWFIDHPIEPKQ